MPTTPQPAFPKPTAVLPGETDILANVLADLSDHDAKLVYADWLEEHDDKRGPLLRKFVTAHRTGKKLPAPKTDALLAIVQPALTLDYVKAPEKSLAVGRSKFGGQPDLPASAEWPEDN